MLGGRGQKYADLFHGEARTRHENALALASEGEVMTFDWSDDASPKESRIIYRTRIFPRRAPGGDITRYDVLTNIISDLRQSEEASTLAVARFKAIFEMSPVPILLTRLTGGVIVDVNRAFCLMTGYAREELLNRTALEVGLWRADDPQG